MKQIKVDIDDTMDTNDEMITDETSEINSTMDTDETSEINSTMDIMDTMDTDETSEINSTMDTDETSEINSTMDTNETDETIDTIDTIDTEIIDIDTNNKYYYKDIEKTIDDMIYMNLDWMLPNMDNQKINEYKTLEFINNIENYIDLLNLKENIYFDEYTILIPYIDKSYHLTTDKSLSINIFNLFLQKIIKLWNNKIEKSKYKNLIINHNFINFTIDIKLYNNSIKYTDNNFYNNIYKYINDPIIFIPVIIHYKKGFSTHFNIIIIDNLNKTITYYEPYGLLNITIDFNHILNLLLNKLITNIINILPNYTYINPHLLNNVVGVQMRSEKYYHIDEGYCVAWCLYLCYIRMFNFHLKKTYSISYLLNKVFEKYSDISLVTLIRVFITYVKKNLKI